MRGELIDHVWSGVKATYIATFEHSAAAFPNMHWQWYVEREKDSSPPIGD